MVELGHEELLERAMVEALVEIDLEVTAEEVGVAPLTDSGGDVVAVQEVVSMQAAGFLTGNRGVSVRLSDGSEFTVEINVYRQPRG